MRHNTRKTSAPRRRRAKAKPCRHTHANYDTRWRGQRITVMGCYAVVREVPHFGYGEDRQIFGARCVDCGMMLPVGPSNDEPAEVQVEIDVAGMLATRSTYLPEICDDVWDVEGVSLAFGNSENYPTAWPWDPTRQVAGQYEEWMRATETEASTPVRHLDGWTGPDDHLDYDPTGEFPDNLSTACPEHPGADADEDGDCMECSAIADDMAEPLTVTIDSDGTPAAQINGLCESPPLFAPDEAEALAGDLVLGADAARQAAQDSYHGPAVVVELCVGDDPEQGEKFEVLTFAADRDPVADAVAAYIDVLPALPADGDLSTLPVLNLDAMEYEITRDAEPDCRDDDGPEVERIIAEMEAEPGPAMKRYLDHEADAACRRVPSLTAAEAAECAALSDSDVCQACGDKWTVHGKTCSGSAVGVDRG